MHERIHQGGKEALFFEGIPCIVLQEISKVVFCRAEEGRAESPQIHGDQGIRIQDDPIRIIVDIPDRSVRERKNAECFCYFDQVAALVRGADAAGDVTMFGNRVFQVLGDHVCFVLFMLQAVKGVSHGCERVPSVIVVGVDDGKRLMDHV